MMAQGKLSKALVFRWRIANSGGCVVSAESLTAFLAKSCQSCDLTKMAGRSSLFFNMLNRGLETPEQIEYVNKKEEINKAMVSMLPQNKRCERYKGFSMIMELGVNMLKSEKKKVEWRKFIFFSEKFSIFFRLSIAMSQLTTSVPRDIMTCSYSSHLRT